MICASSVFTEAEKLNLYHVVHVYLTVNPQEEKHEEENGRPHVWIRHLRHSVWKHDEYKAGTVSHDVLDGRTGLVSKIACSEFHAHVYLPKYQV